MTADSDPEASRASAYSASVANGMMGRSTLGRLGIRRMLWLRDLPARRRTPSDPRLTKRRQLYIIALLLAVVSVVTQYALLLVCALLLLGIAITPELWYRFGMRGLVITRETPSARADFGSVVTIPLMVENRKLLPLPMVETEDEFPEALTVLGTRLGLSAKPGVANLTRSLRLWAYQRVRRRFYVRAVQRGAYTIGPTMAHVSDPFGILTREQVYDTRRNLLVHPLVAPLERFGLSPRALFGDHASRLRLLEDPLRVAGIREYAPGDDPRRVHWKATARLGTLQSKLLDPSTQRTLIIALDVRTFNRAQLGYDPDLAELGISVAASVAAWATERGYAVGLVANGAFSTITAGDAKPPEPARLSGGGTPALPRLRLEPAARPEQLTLILDGLARVLLFGGAAMGPLIAEEMRTAPTGSTLVYVGLDALVAAPTIVALRRAQAGGHAVSLVLTQRDSDDPFTELDGASDLSSLSLPTHYVGGRARWRALVAESLGNLPPRPAIDAPTAEYLAVERKLIADQRKARMTQRHQRKESERDATSGQRQSDGDGDQRADAAQPPTSALA